MGGRKRAAVARGMPDDVAIVEEAAWIMGYHVRMGLGSEAAVMPVVPMTPAGEHSWPPPIANVTAVVVRLWSDAAGHVTHRLLSLEMHGLLFERRDGNPRFTRPEQCQVCGGQSVASKIAMGSGSPASARPCGF